MKTIPHPRLLTKELRRLELCGKYEEAFENVAHFWPSIEVFPLVDGLPDEDQAELLLRCGVLAGFLGRCKKDVNVQENSKNILTKAREIFLESGDLSRIVECEVAIAQAYIRKGEFDEAEAWIDSSFSYDLTPDHFPRLESFLCRMIWFGEQKRWDEVIAFSKVVESYFRDFESDYLSGCFATNVGIAYRNEGNIPEALHSYSLAKYFHVKSGHSPYLATVHNNLANLYLSERRFSLAHKCVTEAIEIYQEVGDLSRKGFSFDTRACILLSEGRLSEALFEVGKGLELLCESEFTEFFVETLFTKIKILTKMQDIAAASICFSDAVARIREVQGQHRVDSLAQEFEEIIRGGTYSGLGKILSEKIVSGEELELELSPSLSVYKKFDAIWIKSWSLASAGLEKGCLALVVNDELSKGDIAALVENGEEDAVCGYFEEAFEMIALCRDDMETEFYRKDSVEILGKIVGFANPDERVEGKLLVRPINRV